MRERNFNFTGFWRAPLLICTITYKLASIRLSASVEKVLGLSHVQVDDVNHERKITLRHYP